MANQGPDDYTRKILLNMAHGLETGRSLAYQYDYNSDKMEDNPDFIDLDDPNVKDRKAYSRNILLSTEERFFSNDKNHPKTEKYKRNPIRVIDGLENAKENINKVLIADVIIPENDPDHDKPVYIAWTGSDNKEKWIADFIEGYPGADSYRRHEKEMVEKIKRTLLEHYKKNPNKPLKLVFTGHSLGGALAQRNFNSFQKELLKDLAEGQKPWVGHMGCTVFNSAGVSKTVSDSSNICSKTLVESGVGQELTYVSNRGDIVSQTGFAILNDPENNKADVHSVFKELLNQSSVAMKASAPFAGTISGAVLGTTLGGPIGGVIGALLGGATLTGAVSAQQLNAHTLNEAEKLDILSSLNPNEVKKVKDILSWKSSLINRAMGNMTKGPDFPSLAQLDDFHSDALKEQFEVVQRRLMGKWIGFTNVIDSHGDTMFHIMAQKNRLDLWQACEEFKVVNLAELIDLNIKNKAGKTPIHIALERGNYQLGAKMLSAYVGDKVALLADLLRWKKNHEKLNNLKAILPQEQKVTFDDLVTKAQALNETHRKAPNEFYDIIKSKDAKKVSEFLTANSGYFAAAWHSSTSRPDMHGNTALHLIAKMQDTESAIQLIKAISEATIRRTGSRMSYTSEEIINLNAINKNGKTPIDKAIKMGHYDIAKAMVALYPKEKQAALMSLIEERMKRKPIVTSFEQSKVAPPQVDAPVEDVVKKDTQLKKL